MNKTTFYSISQNISVVRKKLKSYSWQRSVIWLLLTGLILRLIIALWLFSGYDEGYYYLYTRHLDWSYFDHPLLVALTTNFGVWITGITSIFTLRLGTVILYTGSLWLLYLTSARLFDHKTAKLTLAIVSVVPIFTIGFGVITLPDSPLIFFWTATLYCAAVEFFPNSGRNFYPTYRLAILGVLVGLTCLGKYHGFILGLGLIGFCLTSPPHRCIFLSRWTGLGIILCILTLFPLWFWNLNHDWISFRFQLSNRFETPPGGQISSSRYSLLNVFSVFITELGLLFPTIGIPLWWVIFKSSYSQFMRLFNKKLPKVFRKSNQTFSEYNLGQKQLFILWVSLPLMLGFTLLGGKQQIIVTWPVPGFWSATLLLGFYSIQWKQKSPNLIRWWIRGTGIITTIILLLLLLHTTTGTFYKSSQYSPFSNFFTPQNDPTKELIDIKQLRKVFVQSPELMNALDETTFIFTNAYYLAGLIDLALRPLKDIPVTCFSYDMRGFIFWYDTNQWVGKDGLYITLEQFHKMPHLKNDFSRYFEEFQEIGTVPIRLGGVVVNVFHVYKAKTFLKPYSLEESFLFYKN
ncbi:glycosyl transferase [cyanobacterium endosymbiont of Rhopalodia gibberula]|uniref:ArnT family glycosyltransferase n=1 Tax=cyanobacterium endosymbiont of Rhopalodia gibberula TaxID=1763363 RepID=UPI000DC6F277|nr:glycosyltransferase family 39 protein [cyanobacterium endosymbiont of Rhopalodia gibberula]BBA79223.1 glycosyl transferase [cyanobacterium endosymbiont of Rhopalodia gibberula]